MTMKNRAVGSVLVAGALCMPMATTARADDGASGHRVTYTVTTDRAIDVDVYYRDIDPPTWADYSYDPYRFSPRDDVLLEPGAPWVHDAILADPGRWAMVTVTAAGPPSSAPTTVRCHMTVDGVEVARDEGTRGALCSMRHW